MREEEILMENRRSTSLTRAEAYSRRVRRMRRQRREAMAQRAALFAALCLFFSLYLAVAAR